MIPQIISFVFVAAVSYPKAVTTWLPPAINETERQAIQSGLEQISKGLQVTGGAIMNVALRAWVDRGKE